VYYSSSLSTTVTHATVITGPPYGTVLFCTLSSSSVVVCNALGRSAAAGLGAWPVRRPTLHGGTVRLRPVRATPHVISFGAGTRLDVIITIMKHVRCSASCPPQAVLKVVWESWRGSLSPLTPFPYPSLCLPPNSPWVGGLS